MTTIAVAAVLIAAVGGGAYFLLRKKGGIGLVVTNPSVVSGGTLAWTSSGGTPNGQLQLSVLTNTGVLIVLSPNSLNDPNGNTSGSFNVGPNIPRGVNTLNALDIASNRMGSAPFTVT